MQVKDIILDNSLKMKEKVKILGEHLLSEKATVRAVSELMAAMKDKEKSTCLEAIEYATKERPALLDQQTFQLAVKSLKDKAPGIKRESARIIGNTAHLFPEDLEQAISYLLENAEHTGTVVRWSAAFALSTIVQLKTPWQSELVPALNALATREEKSSIKKIYLKALKTLA